MRKEELITKLKELNIPVVNGKVRKNHVLAAIADMGHAEQPATSGSKEIAKLDKWLEAGKDFGGKPDSCWAAGDTLWSYNTVIAKKHGTKIYVNSTKYSNTTSQYTHHIKQHPGKYQVIEKDEDFFKTSMDYKLEGSGHW